MAKRERLRMEKRGEEKKRGERTVKIDKIQVIRKSLKHFKFK